MGKLFGSIMEMKQNEWVEINDKHAYGQTDCPSEHNTIDHLVTLCVCMEESGLMGEGLYCCFADFKKAFDMVPGDILWKRMLELKSS